MHWKEIAKQTKNVHYVHWEQFGVIQKCSNKLQINSLNELWDFQVA